MEGKDNLLSLLQLNVQHFSKMNFIKIQDEEQEEECVTEENSGAEDEKDDENEKEQTKYEKPNQDEEEEDEDDEEEEESDEEEEPVTEEEESSDDEEEEVEEEEEDDDKLKPEPSRDSGAKSPQADAQMLLKPQRVEPMRLTPPPPPADPNTTKNPTVVDEALQRVLSNDSELTEVNLNNIDDISQVQIQHNTL